MSIETIVLCCIIAGNTLMQAGEIQAVPPAVPDSSYEASSVTENFADQEQAMIALINEERANAGLPPVQKNAALTEMAQVRLQEIMVSFSHERPDDKTKAELMEDVGIRPENYMAENILSGTTASTPQTMMHTFMTSEPHRAWILSEEVNAVGVAIGRNEYNQIYAVQTFGYF